MCCSRGAALLRY